MTDRDHRPWEEPGRVRRDCEPHRGPLLHLLGVISLVFALFTFPTCVSGLIGFSLGVIVVVLARRDLASMNAGLMNPAGTHLTDKAEALAIGGLVFSLVSWFLLAGIWGVMNLLAR